MVPQSGQGNNGPMQATYTLHTHVYIDSCPLEMRKREQAASDPFPVPSHQSTGLSSDIVLGINEHGLHEKYRIDQLIKTLVAMDCFCYLS